MALTITGLPSRVSAVRGVEIAELTGTVHTDSSNPVRVLTNVRLPPGLVVESQGVTLATHIFVSASFGPGEPPVYTGTFTISGTPTASGNYAYALHLIDGNNSQDTASIAFVVTDPPVAPVRVPPSVSGLPSVARGTQAQAIDPITVHVTDDRPGATVSYRGLPAGIVVAPARDLTLTEDVEGSGVYAGTFVISGMPTASGSFASTITVTGADQASVSRALPWVISRDPALSPSISGYSDETVIVGDAITSQTISVRGAPTVSWIDVSLSAAPSGIQLRRGGQQGQSVRINSSRGTVVLEGTPAATGTLTLRARTNFGGEREVEITFTVDPVTGIRPTFTWDTTPAVEAGRSLLEFDEGLSSSYGLLGFTTNQSAGTLSIDMAAVEGVDGHPTTAQAVLSTGTAFRVSGSPTAVGDHQASFRIVDDLGNASETAALLLRVRNNPAPSISGIPVRRVTAGQAVDRIPVYVTNSPARESVTISYLVDGSAALSTLGLAVNKTVTPAEEAQGIAEWLEGTVPPASLAATHQIEITADDGYNAAVTRSFPFYVNRPPLEKPPVITVSSPMRFAHGTASTETFAVSDAVPESRVVVVTLTGLPAGVSVLGGLLSAGVWTVSVRDSGNVRLRNTVSQAPGSWGVGVRAEIQGSPGQAAVASFTLVVTGSLVPVIRNISDQTFVVGTQITAIPVVVDNLPSGEELTVGAAGLPTGLMYRDTLGGGRQVGEIYGTPSDTLGGHSVTVTAVDAAGNSAVPMVFTITLAGSGEIVITGFTGEQVIVGTHWEDVLDSVTVSMPAGITGAVTLTGGTAIGLSLATTAAAAGAVTEIGFNGVVSGSGGNNTAVLTVTGSPSGSDSARAVFDVEAAATGGLPVLEGLRRIYIWERNQDVNIPLTVRVTGGRRPYLLGGVGADTGLTILPMTQSTDVNVWTTGLSGRVSRTARVGENQQGSFQTSYTMDLRPPSLPDSQGRQTVYFLNYLFRYDILELSVPTIGAVSDQMVRQGDRISIDVPITGTVDVAAMTASPAWLQMTRTFDPAHPNDDQRGLLQLRGHVPIGEPVTPAGGEGPLVTLFVHNSAGERTESFRFIVDYQLVPPYIDAPTLVHVRQGESFTPTTPAATATVNIPFQGTGVTASPTVSGPFVPGLRALIGPGNRDRRSYPTVRWPGTVAANATPGNYDQVIRYEDDRNVYRPVTRTIRFVVLPTAAVPTPATVIARALQGVVEAEVYINTNLTPESGTGAQRFSEEENYTSRVIGQVKTFTGRAVPADYFAVDGDARGFLRLWNNDGGLNVEDMWLRQIQIWAAYEFPVAARRRQRQLLLNGYIREAKEEYEGPESERYIDIEIMGELRYFSDILGADSRPLQGMGTARNAIVTLVQQAEANVPAEAAVIGHTGHVILTGNTFILDYWKLVDAGVFGYQGAGAQRVNFMTPLTEFAKLDLGWIWDSSGGGIVHQTAAFRSEPTNKQVIMAILDETAPSTPGGTPEMTAGRIRTHTGSGRYVYTQFAADDRTYANTGEGFTVEFDDFVLSAGETRQFEFTAEPDSYVQGGNWPITAATFDAWSIPYTAQTAQTPLQPSLRHLLTITMVDRGPVRDIWSFTNNSTQTLYVGLTGSRSTGGGNFGPGRSVPNFDVSNVLKAGARTQTTTALPDSIPPTDSRRQEAFRRKDRWGEKRLTLDITAIQNEADRLPFLIDLLMGVNDRRKIYDVRIDGGRHFANNIGFLILEAGMYVTLHAPSAGIPDPIGCWVEAKETQIAAGGLSWMRLLLTEDLPQSVQASYP